LGRAELVIRLLHQISFIAEQVPLDSTTYAMTSLLLSRVVELGGVGTESSQTEQAQEQLTLVRFERDSKLTECRWSTSLALVVGSVSGCRYYVHCS
jgi:hypothetical protein